MVGPPPAAAATRTYSNITAVLGGTATGQDVATGPYVQVSRLGMPLVNEAVLPVQLKDAFNNLPPTLDATLYTAAAPPLSGIGDLLQKSVENPELGRLLCLLYGVPMPKAPHQRGAEVQHAGQPERARVGPHRHL